MNMKNFISLYLVAAFFKQNIFLMTVGLIGILFFSQGAFARGRVIVLTGTQSTGKSTLAASLQKERPGLKFVNFDDFMRNEYAQWIEKLLLEKHNIIHKFPRNNPDRFEKEFAKLFENRVFEISHEEFKDLFERAFATISESILFAVDHDYDVVCDILIDGQKVMKMLREVLSHTVVNVVLVYCSIEDLAQRVASRNSSGRLSEERSFQPVLEQLLDLYYPVAHNYRKSVGTVTRTSVEKLWANKNNGLDEDFKEKFITSLGLDKHDVVGLVPNMAYDLVIDNGSEKSHIKNVKKLAALLPAKKSWGAYIKSLPILRVLFQ